MEHTYCISKLLINYLNSLIFLKKITKTQRPKQDFWSFIVGFLSYFLFYFWVFLLFFYWPNSPFLPLFSLHCDFVNINCTRLLNCFGWVWIRFCHINTWRNWSHFYKGTNTNLLPFFLKLPFFSKYNFEPHVRQEYFLFCQTWQQKTPPQHIWK